nr:hypothetical protein [Pandoravirus massiliensis]
MSTRGCPPSRCHSVAQRFWARHPDVASFYARAYGMWISVSASCMALYFGDAYCRESSPAHRKPGDLQLECFKGFVYGGTFGIVAGIVWPISAPVVARWAWLHIAQPPNPDTRRDRRDA